MQLGSWIGRKELIAIIAIAAVAGALLAANSASALGWRGIRVEVRNQTNQTVRFQYGNQDLELVDGYAKRSHPVNGRLDPGEGRIAETTDGFHALYVGFCGDGILDALRYKNPLIGTPEVREMEGSFGIATSPEAFQVGKAWLFWNGRFRVTRREDSADHIEFLEQILAPPDCEHGRSFPRH